MDILNDPFRSGGTLQELIEYFNQSPAIKISDLDKSNILVSVKQSLVNRDLSHFHYLLIRFDPEIIPSNFLIDVIVQLWEIIAKNFIEAIPLFFAWLEINEVYPVIGKKIMRAEEICSSTLWLFLPQISEQALKAWLNGFDVEIIDLLAYWLPRVNFLSESGILPQTEVTINRIFALFPSTEEGNNEEDEEVVTAKQLLTLKEDLLYPEAQTLLSSCLRQVQGFCKRPEYVIDCLEPYEKMMENILSASHEVKDKVLGPINLFTLPSRLEESNNRDEDDYCGNGCRMLSCNCRRVINCLEGEEEEDNDFFTSECETCNIKIENVAHCVRKITRNGWKGVFCSWACVGKSKKKDRCGTCKKSLKTNEQGQSKGIEELKFFFEYPHLGKYNYFCTEKCKGAFGVRQQSALLMEIAATRLEKVGVYQF